MNKILIICGPTASGKSDLAVECAKKLNTEVISADSMNVYKGLNIGTAKPTIEETQGIKHHLIDVVDCDKTFSVGDYKEKAKPIIDKLLNENKIPIICGGTGFYINSLIYNLSYGNSISNLEARKKYYALAEEKGKDYVYGILKKVDAESAEKISCNDIKRVVRALEIFESGFLKSKIKDSYEPVYDYDAYMIDYPREILYKRIDERVDKMINMGLVDEVRLLMKQGLSNNSQSLQGIGYKEVYAYLNGEINLQDAVSLIKTNTRHYAKRQITFFKKLPNIKYLEPKDKEILSKKIVDNLR